jgi:hypothetical protein
VLISEFVFRIPEKFNGQDVRLTVQQPRPKLDRISQIWIISIVSRQVAKGRGGQA